MIHEHLGGRAIFIGGVAVESYAPYRSTHDVDVVTRERDFADLKRALLGAGFSHRSTHLSKHTFKARGVGEVDAYTAQVGEVALDEEFFRRARSLVYGGVRISVPSVEHLLRFKFSAGREMDLADVAVLLLRRRSELDVGLVERLVGRDVLQRLSPLVPELLPQEYGWKARRELTGWLREVGWIPATRRPKTRR